MLDSIASTLPLPPWWVWAALAVGTFVLLHWIAGQEAAPVTRPSEVTPAIIGGFLRRIAWAGQYVIPPVFALVAIVTLVRQADTAAPEDDLYEVWKDVDATPAPAIDESRWNMGLLKALEWKRFEILCATYFEAIGLRARRTRAGPDGGVDIRLYSEGSTAPGILVQCKAWREWPVGVALVRELFGVMAAEKVREGILVSTSTFTPEAIAFAKGKNIHLIDGKDFLGKLLALDEARQYTIRKLVTEGDYTTPTCPSCGDGTKMRLRVAKKDGSRFWGCSRFPECTSTMRVGQAEAGLTA
ncbi:MAG: DUF2034 domain-containing protein [Burkholderiales bacterium]|nr:DUF2034 domain-containing protein [Burkholderiales bacterium]